MHALISLALALTNYAYIMLANLFFVVSSILTVPATGITLVIGVFYASAPILFAALAVFLLGTVLNVLADRLERHHV